MVNVGSVRQGHFSLSQGPEPIDIQREEVDHIRTKSRTRAGFVIEEDDLIDSPVHSPILQFDQHIQHNLCYALMSSERRKMGINRLSCLLEA